MRPTRIVPVSLCLAAWLSPAVPVHGDAPGAWIASARENNAELRKARGELQAALARVPQAKALPDPAVELEAMGQDVAGSEQDIRLAQSFPWPGTLGYRGAAASMQAQAYWLEAQQLELALAARIRVIAAEIAYLKRVKGLIAQNLALYQKQEEYLRQATRGGGDASELLRVEMESGSLSDELAQTDERIRRELAELCAIIGRDVSPSEADRIPPHAGPAPAREQAGLHGMAEATNPGLQALALRAEAARTGVALARLETYPEFMVSAGVRRVSEPGMGVERERMTEAVAVFSVSLPIWGEKNRGKREEAAAMLEVAQSEHLNGARMLRARLDTLLSRGRDARRRADLYRSRLIPKARQAHEAVEASYRAGRAGLLEVFDIRRALLEAETGYWRAVADTHINHAEIGALFGTEVHSPKP